MIGNGCSGSETFNDVQLRRSAGQHRLPHVVWRHEIGFLHGRGLVGTPLFGEIVTACPDPKPDWGYNGQCSGLTQVVMCGLDVQEYIDQFFNSASCMGPVPAEHLGKGYVTSGQWESQGGLPANFTAEFLNDAWNSSYWPVIAGADAEFVAAHGLTSANTWRMKRPGRISSRSRFLKRARWVPTARLLPQTRSVVVSTWRAARNTMRRLNVWERSTSTTSTTRRARWGA